MKSILKLAGEFLFLAKIAQSYSDIRSMPGVNSQLFGPQSWNYINQLMKVMDAGLQTQSATTGRTVDFRSVVLSPSLASGYSGSLTVLVQACQLLWQYVTSKKAETYTVDEAKAIENAIETKIAGSAFSEPGASTIKDNLIHILSNWKAIL